MRILFFSQYYFPETGATSNRVYSLAKTFQDEGHDVRVIAEKPNHPEGVFHKGYRRGAFIDGDYNGVPVTWCWVHTGPDKGFLGRILFYTSYMVMAVWAVFRLKGKYDVVLASSPPLFVGLSGWAAARIKRARFVFDVRDLWPEVAVKMGELNNPKAIRLAESIERFLYRKADLITVVTESFRESIIAKGIKGDRIEMVTNGTEPDAFFLNEKPEGLRQKWNLPSGFIVSFVGNLGLAQGLDHILEAAHSLQNDDVEDVFFLFVGDGPRKAGLVEKAVLSGLRNVIFRDRVSLPEAVEYMNASDLLLVSLANDPIYKKFIPSKLFDAMAASKPVLLSVDGESHRILDESGGGIWYPAEDASKLKNALLHLKNDAATRTLMGQKGKEFVRRHYTRRAQALKMLSMIDNRFM
jgi:glycosyltransferase involved in cell wall biosynthesis